MLFLTLKQQCHSTEGNSDVAATHTHTHPFNGPLSGTTKVSRYQKGKSNLDFTEARGSEWQWHQLGHMQVCTSLQTDNHASTPPLSFLQAGCPSCRPTNSVKAMKTSQQVTRYFDPWSRPTDSDHAKCTDYQTDLLRVLDRAGNRAGQWPSRRPRCSSTWPW